MDDLDMEHCQLQKCFTKKIIKKGIGWRTPNEGSVCQLRIDLDDEFKDLFAMFGYEINADTCICIGEGKGEISEVIDLVLQNMKEGEVCQVSINTTALWDKIYFRLDISEQSTLPLRVELYHFERQNDVFQMSVNEKLQRAERLKTLGSECFKNGQPRLAEKFYIRSLKYIITIGRAETVSLLEEEERNKYSVVKCLCSLNLAACHLKHKRYEDAVKNCSTALKIDGALTKGYFRRGQAYMHLNDFELAEKDFLEGLRLEPENKSILSQMKILDGKVKRVDEGYARAMSKMFNPS